MKPGARQVEVIRRRRPTLNSATLRELAGEIVRYEPHVHNPKPETAALFSAARTYMESIGEPPEDRTDTSNDGTEEGS